MKVPLQFVLFLVSVLPVLAAPNCPAPQVVNGDNCTYSASLGWVAAGQGIVSILTIYVPPNASGPVDFEVTSLRPTLGNAYSGYFGIKVGDLGDPDHQIVVTAADVAPGAPASIGAVPPGSLQQVAITQVCWDPTCTSPAPTGAVPNAFTVQFSMSSPNPSDISLTPSPRLTIQFLNGTQVTWQENENALRSNSLYDIIPGISLGATEATRYVFNGSAVTQPFDAISISNLNNPGPLGGTVILRDSKGQTVATTKLPQIPPGGAAGFLVIGRNPGDSAALFPSNTVLPASADGIFHGTLVVSTTGQTPSGQCIVLVQEYNGNAMTNMPVFHSPVL